MRDTDPDAFLAAHRALFAARHDQGRDLRDREVVAKVLADHGVDVDAVFAAVDDGALLATVRDEHEAAVAEHDVWGVPTFIVGDQAVFVRLMDRPGGDGAHARATIERVVDLLGGCRPSTSSSTPRSPAEPGRRAAAEPRPRAPWTGLRRRGRPPA